MLIISTLTFFFTQLLAANMDEQRDFTYSKEKAFHFPFNTLDHHPMPNYNTVDGKLDEILKILRSKERRQKSKNNISQPAERPEDTQPSTVIRTGGSNRKARKRSNGSSTLLDLELLANAHASGSWVSRSPANCDFPSNSGSCSPNLHRSENISIYHQQKTAANTEPELPGDNNGPEVFKTSNDISENVDGPSDKVSHPPHSSVLLSVNQTVQTWIRMYPLPSFCAGTQTHTPRRKISRNWKRFRKKGWEIPARTYLWRIWKTGTRYPFRSGAYRREIGEYHLSCFQVIKQIMWCASLFFLLGKWFFEHLFFVSFSQDANIHVINLVYSSASISLY